MQVVLVIQTAQRIQHATGMCVNATKGISLMTQDSAHNVQAQVFHVKSAATLQANTLVPVKRSVSVKATAMIPLFWLHRLHLEQLLLLLFWPLLLCSGRHVDIAMDPEGTYHHYFVNRKAASHQFSDSFFSG